MKPRLSTGILLLGLAVSLMASPGLAAPPAGSAEPDRLEEMIEDGWTPVAPGVLQRSKGDHRVETFAMGPEGFAWMAQQLQARLGFLLDELRARPTPQLRKAIRKQRAEIAKLQSYAGALEATEPQTEILADCDLVYGAHAYTYPTRPVQGIRAEAEAYFYNSCGIIGETSACAYAFAKSNGTPVSDTACDSDSGPNIRSYAEAGVAGSDCYAYATARVSSFEVGFSYQIADESFICPLDLTAGINGPTSVTIFDYACKTVTWTSTVAGGTPGYSGYTYAWYIDGTFAGSGSSLSRTYCGNGTAYTNVENVSLTVTDSLGWTASDTHTTSIYFRVSCLASPTEKALPQPCCVYSASGKIICPY